MKVKSLALLLSAGLFAATASATSVVLYGSLDAAVKVEHTKTTAESTLVNHVVKKVSEGNLTTQLVNGMYSGSKLGFKGDANVTASSVAGFQMEMGFDTMTGYMNPKVESQFTKIFNRGAFVYLQGGFGRLSIGYMPSYLTNFGPNNVFARTANPFIAAKAGGNAGFLLGSGAVVNNAIAYQSPKIVGLQLGLFFSPDAKNDGNKFKKNVRMGQVALSFEGGPVQLVVMGSRTYTPWGVTVAPAQNKDVVKLLQQAGFAAEQKHDDAVVKAAANVALGEHVKVFVAGSKTWKGAFNMNGWDASVGTSLSFGGNTLGLNFLYGKQDKDFKKQDKKVEGLDVSTFGVQARYDYALTKYAHLYLGAQYKQVENKLTVVGVSGNAKLTQKMTQGYLGMSYKF